MDMQDLVYVKRSAAGGYPRGITPARADYSREYEALTEENTGDPGERAKVIAKRAKLAADIAAEQAKAAA